MCNEFSVYYIHTVKHLFSMMSMTKCLCDSFDTDLYLTDLFSIKILEISDSYKYIWCGKCHINPGK